MIQKLRRKFILLTMTALLTVLIIIMGCINIVNFNNTVKDADTLLLLLADNEGTFPELKNPEDPIRPKPDPKPPVDDDMQNNNLKENDMGKDNRIKDLEKTPFRFKNGISEETPYETRFFSVLFTKDTGSFLEADTNHIASVDQKQAIEYAKKAYSKTKKSCFIDHFRYLRYEENDNLRIIFLDCSKSLNSSGTFLLISFGISGLGFAIVTLIIVFFSGRIIRPISESYEKQKRFITDASHEIKTPLTIINADADILEMELEDNEWIMDIKRQTKRLTELTNNLVLLTRMEETEISIQKIDFPISDVVKEAALSFQSLAQTQNKVMDLQIQPMLSFCGDSKRIHQLVMLLLDNAIKYSPENSMITVSLEKSAKYLHFHVINQTLTPLTKENLQSLFERFYRVDSSRNSSTGGYGIGLSVAKAIVESHNGKIKAVSEGEDILHIQVQLPV